MEPNANPSQQDADKQTQDDLTDKVGESLEPREKSGSPWDAVKRLLRLN